MTYTVIVHEDKQPTVRHKIVKQRDDLTLLLARTHNGLLDSGYALSRSMEKDGQKVTTYTYVKAVDPSMTDVHVVVIDG